MARRNMLQHEWARQRFERLRKQCDEFLADYSDEELYTCILSMHGQTFAYGITGCPQCKKSFPSTGEAYVRMFERFPAKKLTCPGCSCMLPNESFPDDGQGFTHDGAAYYPIGMWNFHMAGWLLGGVRDHEGMVTRLTYIYMLTGEKTYARKAAAILDAFAAIFPHTIGPRDFTPFASSMEMGRLHLLTSIVYRVKVFLAHDYDWLYDLEDMETPSPACALLGEPKSVRENIERMLNDYLLTEPGGPVYNLEGGNLTELHNHEADGVRAMLAVGLITGREEYQTWGIHATEVFLSNAVGRDGMYFEGSYGYSMFTITVFLDMALLSMRAASLSGISAAHPFASERFFRFAVQNPLEMLCQGHLPCYGDWGQDRTRSEKPDNKTITDTYRAALHFHHYTPDSRIRAQAADWLRRLYPLVSSQLGEKGSDLFLLHPAPAQPLPFTLPQHTTITGQAGIGILRDANRTTLLMRAGANHTHAHDEVLGFTYYAYGKEISADLGYSTYGSNGHYGWSTKAIAHNTVVVNMDDHMKKGQLYKPFSGGEFTCLYESPAVTALEGAAPGLYGIDAYQRLLGLVPLPDGSSYVADFFYVRGAQTSDYSFRAFHEKAAFALEGVKKAEQAKKRWTLAGLDASARPYFDQPGQSFGERLTTGETFTPLLKEEKPQYWTPVPNNGYGFIYGIEEHQPTGACIKAAWRSEEGYELTWHGLADGDDRIITGQYPNLSGTERHPLLIIRSRRPAKQYAAVIHTTKKENRLRILSVHRLATRGGETTAYAAAISNGWLDFWAYSPTAQTMIIHTRFGPWRVEGRCGFLRTDGSGKTLAYACLHASSMTFQGKQMEGIRKPWFPIKMIEKKKGAIRLDPHLPPEGARFIRMAPAKNAPASLYEVRDVHSRKDATTILLRDATTLSKGVVAACTKNLIHTRFPLPLGAAFCGTFITGERGGHGIIEDIPAPKTIRARILSPFTEGEAFDITDLAEDGWAQWL